MNSEGKPEYLICGAKAIIEQPNQDSNAAIESDDQIWAKYRFVLVLHADETRKESRRYT